MSLFSVYWPSEERLSLNFNEYYVPIMNLHKLHCFPGITGVIISMVECTLPGGDGHGHVHT